MHGTGDGKNGIADISMDKRHLLQPIGVLETFDEEDLHLLDERRFSRFSRSDDWDAMRQLVLAFLLLQQLVDVLVLVIFVIFWLHATHHAHEEKEGSVLRLGNET